MKKNYRKLVLVFSVSLLMFVLSGCAKKQVYMDQPASDGNYHYQNEALGFTQVLPVQFKYYQTQRKEGEGYKEIEFFIPTSDTNYVQEVQGYAKPLVVRVYDSETWKKLAQEEALNYKMMEEKDGKVFVISYWKEIPADWKDKWKGDLKNLIENGFKAI